MNAFHVISMHCVPHHLYSDGMGRTGAFICMCSEVERMKMEGSADIFQSVKAARNQRPYMVSTVVSARHIHLNMWNMENTVLSLCIDIQYARCHVVPIWIFVLPSLYRTSMYSSIKWWCVSWRPFKFMKILVLQWQALILHNLNKSTYFTYFILCSSCVLYSWHTYVCHSNHDDFVHTVLIPPQCRELP